ncbi:MAG TPA: hypothetical protein VMF06_22590, partial [Candidatus Limnocylindria bacterium]|nr:hypothetical protein [Candidatus Limnocylindria bacterium]
PVASHKNPNPLNRSMIREPLLFTKDHLSISIPSIKANPLTDCWARREPRPPGLGARLVRYSQREGPG